MDRQSPSCAARGCGLGGCVVCELLVPRDRNIKVACLWAMAAPCLLSGTSPSRSWSRADHSPLLEKRRSCQCPAGLPGSCHSLTLCSQPALTFFPLSHSEFSVLAEDSGSFRDFAVNISRKLKVCTPVKSQPWMGFQGKPHNPGGTAPDLGSLSVVNGHTVTFSSSAPNKAN